MSRKHVVEKKGIDTKFYIYIVTILMFGLLGLFLFIFGLDFGFVKIGGLDIPPIVMLMILGLILIVEYIYETKYCLALRQYTQTRTTFLDYIPYIQSMSSYPRWVKIVSYVIFSYLIFAVLVVVTPIARLLPARLIVNVTQNIVLTGITSLLFLLVVRGVDNVLTKNTLIRDYTELCGATGTGVLASKLAEKILYFIPGLRAIQVIQDRRFIETLLYAIEIDSELE